MKQWILTVLIFPLSLVLSQGQDSGVRKTTFLNYSDCLELFNKETVVVLCHQVGGRVLSYRHQEKEALYISPKEKDWQPGKKEGLEVSAGRFDIGPEFIVPKREVLWSGEWKAEVMGPRAARLTSAKDEATGVRLIREFQLSETSSILRCKQIIENISNETKHWCHWSRTFAKHGGIVYLPLSPESMRFPKGYVMYGPGRTIQYQPEDPQISIRDHFLQIAGPPKYPKLGMDSLRGWFAYHMPNDLLFVKRFPVFPDKAYNEVAGLTTSIWYPEASFLPTCEIEPIGPRNVIPPKGTASFTEEWELIKKPFHSSPSTMDLAWLIQAGEKNQKR